jgi:hypothetical protein
MIYLVKWFMLILISLKYLDITTQTELLPCHSLTDDALYF